jgi:hypothetical protein
MPTYCWCQPSNADDESHGWQSSDGGKTWRSTGDTASRELGPVELIDLAQGCPICKSPLSTSAD